MFQEHAQGLRAMLLTQVPEKAVNNCLTFYKYIWALYLEHLKV